MRRIGFKTRFWMWWDGYGLGAYTAHRIIDRLFPVWARYGKVGTPNEYTATEYRVPFFVFWLIRLHTRIRLQKSSFVLFRKHQTMGRFAAFVASFNYTWRRP